MFHKSFNKIFLNEINLKMHYRWFIKTHYFHDYCFNISNYCWNVSIFAIIASTQLQTITNPSFTTISTLLTLSSRARFPSIYRGASANPPICPPTLETRNLCNSTDGEENTTTSILVVTLAIYLCLFKKKVMERRYWRNEAII